MFKLLASGIALLSLGAVLYSVYPYPLTPLKRTPYSPYYNVYVDKETNYIYLDPKESHESTIIFFHGFGGHSSDSFKLFGEHKMAPLTSSIILA